MERKAFDNTLKTILAHAYNDLGNSVGVKTTAKHFDKLGLWSPCDLIAREYLNNGGGSARGFLGIMPSRCIEAYRFMCSHKDELVADGLISEKGSNNFGITLWSNYNFDR